MVKKIYIYILLLTLVLSSLDVGLLGRTSFALTGINGNTIDDDHAPRSAILTATGTSISSYKAGWLPPVNTTGLVEYMEFYSRLDKAAVIELLKDKTKVELESYDKAKNSSGPNATYVITNTSYADGKGNTFTSEQIEIQGAMAPVGERSQFAYDVDKVSDYKFYVASISNNGIIGVAQVNENAATKAVVNTKGISTINDYSVSFDAPVAAAGISGYLVLYTISTKENTLNALRAQTKSQLEALDTSNKAKLIPASSVNTSSGEIEFKSGQLPYNTGTFSTTTNYNVFIVSVNSNGAGNYGVVGIAQAGIIAKIDLTAAQSEMIAQTEGQLTDFFILFNKKLNSAATAITNVNDLIQTLEIVNGTDVSVVSLTGASANSVKWLRSDIAQITIPAINLQIGDQLKLSYKAAVKDTFNISLASPALSPAAVKDDAKPVGRIIQPLEQTGLTGIEIHFNEKLSSETTALVNAKDMAEKIEIITGTGAVKSSIDLAAATLAWTGNTAKITIPATNIVKGDLFRIRYTDKVKDYFGNPASNEGTSAPIGGAFSLSTVDIHTSVLNEIRKAAGGRTSKIAVLTSGSAGADASDTYYKDVDDTATGISYEKEFIRYGFEPIYIPVNNVNYQTQRNNMDNVLLANEATAVYFNGGDQFRHAKALFNDDGTDSLVLSSLKQIFYSGGVATGSSAGDHILSSPMHGGGDSFTDMNNNGMVTNSLSDSTIGQGVRSGIMPGFGFISAYGTTDSHFDQRGRIGRLIVAMRETNQALGFGVDENTAFIVSEGKGRAFGANGVFVVDASQALFSDSGTGVGKEFAVTGIKVHYLSDGDQYDFKTRTVLSNKPLLSAPAKTVYNSSNIFNSLENTKVITTLVDSAANSATGISSQFKLIYSKDSSTVGYKNGSKYTVSNMNLAVNKYASSITVDGINLNPKYNLNTTEYNLNVLESKTSVSVKAIVDDSTTALTINDATASSGDAQTVALSPDATTTITIKASPATGVQKTYTLTITKTAAMPEDSATPRSIALVARGASIKGHQIAFLAPEDATGVKSYLLFYSTLDKQGVTAFLQGKTRNELEDYDLEASNNAKYLSTGKANGSANAFYGGQFEIQAPSAPGKKIEYDASKESQYHFYVASIGASGLLAVGEADVNAPRNASITQRGAAIDQYKVAFNAPELVSKVKEYFTFYSGKELSKILSAFNGKNKSAIEQLAADHKGAISTAAGTVALAAGQTDLDGNTFDSNTVYHVFVAAVGQAGVIGLTEAGLIDTSPVLGEINSPTEGELKQFFVLFNKKLDSSTTGVNHITDLLDSLKIINGSNEALIDIGNLATESVSWVRPDIARVQLSGIHLAIGDKLELKFKPAIKDIFGNQSLPVVSKAAIRDDVGPVGRIIQPVITDSLTSIEVRFSEPMDAGTKAITDAEEMIKSIAIVGGSSQAAIDIASASVSWSGDTAIIAIPATKIVKGNVFKIAYKDSVKDAFGNPVHNEGTAAPIGGAFSLDTTDIHAQIFGALWRAAGGRTPVIAMLQSSYASAADANDVYFNDAGSTISVEKEFIKYGFDPVYIPLNRTTYMTEANKQANVEKANQATAVYFAGGDQFLHARSLINDDGSDSLVLTSLKQIFYSGGLATGSSAGDHILSGPMFGGGGSYEDLVHNEMIKNKVTDPDLGDIDLNLSGIVQGFGFMSPYGITDSHFDTRGRLGRLLVAMRDSNQKVGIGVDENTAIAVNGDVGTVYGENAVFIVDATNASFSKAGSENIFAASGVIIHYLTNGDQYNFKFKTVYSSNSLIAVPAKTVYLSNDIFGSYENTKVMTALIDSSANTATGVSKKTDPQFEFTYSKNSDTKGYKSGSKYTIDHLALSVQVTGVIAEPKGDNAKLSEIKVDGTLLNGFSSEIDSYEIQLPAGTAIVPTVAAIAMDSKVKSTIITPAESLPGTTKIVVTAEDELTKKTYQIHFSVQAPTVPNVITKPEVKAPDDAKKPEEAVKTAQEAKVFTVSSDLIKTVNGKSTIDVPTAATELKIPANAIEGLILNKLEVKLDRLTLEIPAGLIKQLTGSLNAAELKDSTISLKFNKLSESDVKNVLAKGQNADKGEINLIGDAYEFNLSIAYSNDKSTQLSKFDEPILLRFKAAPAMDSKLAGVYYIADSGALEYIGGELSNGEMIAKVSHFSKYGVLEINKSFADVSNGYWAAPVIKELAAKLIMEGTGSNLFEPERLVTRAEFAALLVRTLKLTEKANISFTDVHSTDWFADTIAIAVKAGLVSGKSEARFDPYGEITREEMVAMLMRARVILKGQAAEVAKGSFKDMAQVSSWALEYVKEAEALHLIQGRKPGLFVPKGLSNRAEATQLIYNLLNN